MCHLFQLMLLVTAGGSCVLSQGLPFQVNRVESCTTQISLDTSTLTGVKRGDERFPCSGYLLYTDSNDQTERMCHTDSHQQTDYQAQRACYTMGVNFFRDSTTFSADRTRQMMLYKCFEYEEQNVDSAEEGQGNAVFLQSDEALSRSLEQGCLDKGADPTVFDCFDTCYNTVANPTLGTGDNCFSNHPYFAVGCADINECVNGVRDYCTGPFESSCTIRKACGNNTDCTNHDGSFECTCKVGFENRNANSFDPYDLSAGCRDVDDCQLSKCDTNAECINTIGSYFCLCEPGYTGDGHTCAKTDECELSVCDNNAECTNTIYSYFCTCKDGYIGDGYTCTKLPCKPLPYVPNGEWTVPYYGYRNYVFADTAECRCSEGYTASAKNIPESIIKDYGYRTYTSFILTCDANGDWGQLPVPKCLPVSCGDPDMIDHANRMGSGLLYMQSMTYQCHNGYRVDNPRLGVSSFVRTCLEDGKWTKGTTCVDVDECEDTPEVCGDRDYCFNIGGSYICVPFFPDTCDLQKDLDLCKNGKCEMKKGKGECICDDGYTGILCETPVIGLGVILPIVSVVLGGLLLLLCILLIFCLVIHRPQAGPQPAYGRHGLPTNIFGKMHSLFQLTLLIVVVCDCAHAQGMPFQVNNPRKESCATQISLDTGTLTGVKRGDERFPCSGYLMYTDTNDRTERMCSSTNQEFTDYEAQRACYTMGVNFFRDSNTFSADKTRQMMLYRCFEYEEQNVESAEEGAGDTLFVLPGPALSASLEQGCLDKGADPSVFDCFDTCYLTASSAELKTETNCQEDEPFFTIGCVDINECVNGVRDYCTGPFESSCTIRKACGNNTDCTNHDGSFECTCKDGFENRNANSFDPYDLSAGCRDVDECQLSRCDSNADCINTIGSYFCLCEPGYTGDGHTCTRTDECELSVCDDNAECTNTIYSYFCTCNDGYTGDGYTCNKSPCKSLPIVPNGRWTVPFPGYVNYVFGDIALFKCLEGYNVSVKNIPTSLVKAYGYKSHASFTLTCDAIGDWGPLPVPECLPVSCGDPDIIDDASRMVSGSLYMQSVTYQCQKGYRVDNQRLGASSFVRTCLEDGTWTEGSTCVDIDECEDTPEVCGERHFCFNTGGSYICVPFFPETCDLQTGLDLCKNGKCEMNEGKAECICDNGYMGILCETPVIGLGVILAIAGIILGGLLLLLLIFVICCLAIHRPQFAPEPVYGKHWPPTNMFGARRSPIDRNYIG